MSLPKGSSVKPKYSRITWRHLPGLPHEPVYPDGYMPSLPESWPGFHRKLISIAFQGKTAGFIHTPFFLPEKNLVKYSNINPAQGMDTEYLLSEAEKQIDKASADFAKQLANETKDQVNALAGSDIYIGTDTNYYTSDTGNKGASSDFVSGSNGRWGSWWSDSYSWTAGIGSASAWAFNAKQINVKGSGSKNAYIRFRGNYSGWTLPGFTGGTAAARIRVSVYDLTANSEIGGTVVKDVSDSVNWGSTFNQVAFNNSVLVSLQAGHSYLLRYGVSTSTSNYGPQMCQSDFWDDTKHGIYQDYVTVDWQ